MPNDYDSCTCGHSWRDHTTGFCRATLIAANPIGPVRVDCTCRKFKLDVPDIFDDIDVPCADDH